MQIDIIHIYRYIANIMHLKKFKRPIIWDGGSSTPSVPNYRSFDFFDTKFDHSSYSKICAKHHFFIVACFISTSS